MEDAQPRKELPRYRFHPSYGESVAAKGLQCVGYARSEELCDQALMTSIRSLGNKMVQQSNQAVTIVYIVVVAVLFDSLEYT